MVGVSVQVIDRGSAGCRVLICGEVDLATIGTLEDALAVVADQVVPGERVVLDAAGVGFLSAGGVRVLMRFAEGLTTNGSELAITPVSPAVAHMLGACGYPGVFGASSS